MKQFQHSRVFDFEGDIIIDTTHSGCPVGNGSSLKQNEPAIRFNLAVELANHRLEAAECE